LSFANKVVLDKRLRSDPDWGQWVRAFPGLFQEAAASIDRYRQVTARAQVEVQRLAGQQSAGRFSPVDVQQLRQRFQSLRNRNLAEATFEERLDLVARLDIRVYPSEDLRSRRITCRLNLGAMVGGRVQEGSERVLTGVPACRNWSKAV